MIKRNSGFIWLFWLGERIDLFKICVWLNNIKSLRLFWNLVMFWGYWFREIRYCLERLIVVYEGLDIKV